MALSHDTDLREKVKDFVDTNMKNRFYIFDVEPADFRQESQTQNKFDVMNAKMKFRKMSTYRNSC